jgi:pimeloyl-ACP methyl ester carboxylesterase
VVGLKLAQKDPAKITALIGSGVIGRGLPEQLATSVPKQIADYRKSGWEWLLAGFDKEEPTPVPEWMKARIRATDLKPVIGWLQARQKWNWAPWEAAAEVTAPTLFAVGAIEDPDDTMAELASKMPDAIRVRIPQRGHINAFLASNLVLPHVMAFLARRRLADRIFSERKRGPQLATTAIRQSVSDVPQTM